MKRTWVALFLLAISLRAFPAGLIIVDEAQFRGSPPVVVPPNQPWPEPNPMPGRRIMPPPRPHWQPLQLAFTKVDGKIKDQVATTQVDQEFYNPNPQRLEGTFLFPLPKGAQIGKFTMLVNGKPAEAELLKADKARGIYEEIVRKQRDPALLEYAGRDLFRVRIFPIEPNERKHVTLAWSQVLRADAGSVSYVLPLKLENVACKAANNRNLSLKLSLESKRGLQSIYSPSHKVEVKRDGAHKATIGFESSDAISDADFQLFYTEDDSDLGVNLLTYRDGNDDGYFLLMASPGVETKRASIMPKDVVFVLDTSGSMAGPKLEQAKKALSFCIENLDERDRFEVMRFSTEVESLFEKLSAATKDNRASAQKFVSALKPIGGTAIDDALKKALTLRPNAGTQPFVVVFLTDGRPTVGEVNEARILEHATNANTGLTRIFCFGIGTDVNTHLLDNIAEQTRAFSQYVLPEEDLEVKVSSFFTKIREPVLANPQVSFGDGIKVTKMYPAALPDLFRGEQLIAAGRYSGHGGAAVTIEGAVNGRTRKFSYDVSLPERATENDFVPKLWATRRVGYLLDEIRLRGESQELKDEVAELARKYGIVTPYTAYLITQDEATRNVPLSMQSLPRAKDEREAAFGGGQWLRGMEKEKTGLSAVADARSFNALKVAEAPRSAVVAGNVEALRVQAAPGIAGRAAAATAQTPASSAQVIEQQSRFVGGRNFFQNGSQWVDSNVQKNANARRVQVQFGSEDYFNLVRTNAAVRPWLALGRQVQFVSGGTIIEIVE